LGFIIFFWVCLHLVFLRLGHLLGIVLIIDFAYRLEILPCYAKGLFDNSRWESEAGFGGADIAISLGVAIRSSLTGAVGARRGGVQGGIATYVFEDAVEEGGEGGDFARAEEGKSVVLDRGRPVGVVGVEGMKESFLNPARRTALAI
jgi:hypothetical protein